MLSLLLLIALVWLYYQQSNILKEQKEVSKRQVLPELDLVEREIDGDQLTVEVVNHGGGPAKNLRFITSANSSKPSVDPETTSSRARRSEKGSLTLERSIGPHERAEFTGAPSFGLKIDGETLSYANFSTAFESMIQQQIEHIRFQIYLVGDD